MRDTVTTAEAAFLLGLARGSIARWCRERHVEPLYRERRGRSTVTIWSVTALRRAAAPSQEMLDKIGVRAVGSSRSVH